ncbi:hypothetical protein CDAR_63561 [Caerostris darwini]|uniref:Prolactin receptor n=1 Tax=Caerostris darwini TaxID=1538125 RepID=A0AAV4QID2_9ARAC|nr:hypothetical protein CDAR_63561 [Caerostris darwini]
MGSNLRERKSWGNDFNCTKTRDNMHGVSETAPPTIVIGADSHAEEHENTVEGRMGYSSETQLRHFSQQLQLKPNCETFPPPLLRKTSGPICGSGNRGEMILIVPKPETTCMEFPKLRLEPS